MKTLRLNTKHAAEVKELKKLLNAKIGSGLDVTNGNFFAKTDAEVKKFQRQQGLLPDGIVGPLTWAALYSNITAEPTVSLLLTKVGELLATQVGVKELTGKNDGVEVEAYLKSVGLSKGYAWCQAFMYWAFDKVSKELLIGNPLHKTAGVLNNWNNSTIYQQKTPKAGDIFVMDFGKGAGHTGFVVRVDGKYIETIEGNTSADPKLPSEDREGQGVYRRRRLISSINKGFLRYA